MPRLKGRRRRYKGLKHVKKKVPQSKDNPLNPPASSEQTPTEDNSKDPPHPTSIMQRHRSHISSLIKIGDMAAYDVKDANVDRFYIVKWDTEPYVDNETGKPVCDACF